MLQETLKQLCDLYGPSGSEEAVRQAIRDAVAGPDEAAHLALVPPAPPARPGVTGQR